MSDILRLSRAIEGKKSNVETRALTRALRRIVQKKRGTNGRTIDGQSGNKRLKDLGDALLGRPSIPPLSFGSFFRFNCCLYAVTLGYLFLD